MVREPYVGPTRLQYGRDVRRPYQASEGALADRGAVGWVEKSWEAADIFPQCLSSPRHPQWYPAFPMLFWSPSTQTLLTALLAVLAGSSGCRRSETKQHPSAAVVPPAKAKPPSESNKPSRWERVYERHCYPGGSAPVLDLGGARVEWCDLLFEFKSGRFLGHTPPDTVGLLPNGSVLAVGSSLSMFLPGAKEPAASVDAGFINHATQPFQGDFFRDSANSRAVEM